MKVILSRKGFDSTNGRCPSPIFPDGTLLSLPIPSDDSLAFEDILYNGTSYKELLSELNPKVEYSGCHLDPDIRLGVRKNNVCEWKPAFGQSKQSQAYLVNAGVMVGDLFLFFGRFQEVMKNQNGLWKYNDKSPVKHIIYGYLQIGDILTTTEKISKYYWHPHASHERISNSRNALYIPTYRFNIIPDRKGYGVWDYDEKRVLTMDGGSTATWKNHSFLEPENVVGNRKNSAKMKGIYYSGIWQELVVKENMDATEWAIQLFDKA